MKVEFLPKNSPVVKDKVAVLTELLSFSEEGKAERIEFTPSGFVAAITVPGDKNSGAIYLYDEPSGYIFWTSVDGRTDDFNRAEIDAIVPYLVAGINAASGVIDTEASARRNQGRRNRHGRNRNRNFAAGQVPATRNASSPRPANQTGAPAGQGAQPTGHRRHHNRNRNQNRNQNWNRNNVPGQAHQPVNRSSKPAAVPETVLV